MLNKLIIKVKTKKKSKIINPQNKSSKSQNKTNVRQRTNTIKRDNKKEIEEKKTIRRTTIK